MAAADDMLIRVKVATPTIHLARLTNINAPGASTINDVVLLEICKEVNGDFLKEAGAEYDDANEAYYATAKMGVLYRLRLAVKGRHDDELTSERDDYFEGLESVAEVTGRDRVEPQSESNYEPSTPENGKPPFDDGNFDGLI